ncbi:MAG: hypothetical protein A2086_11340 [Spirochaetes bacterium GWD1_27_9]|nr:MAG: hypothetical protein A2Z98_07575 [Spirochaetes bacterium GWB1_27_13]OHD21513.1 MAG: hypothetical protein A2Y34_01555 [Spirochaetes bacterium GWC1_27_15]OHD33047.1 MAG: hypothetical protein A2086_11340 [Spirochaetes bacterium GWD1_27_9]
MKKTLFFVIFSILSFSIFAQKINISDIDIDQFVENLKQKKEVNLRSYYLWSGLISDIDEAKNEVVVLKAKWISKSELASYKVILKITNPMMKEKIKKLGKDKKILFIAEIIEVKDIIPICNPIFIREN